MRKTKGGRENRAPEKGSWKHGDLCPPPPQRHAHFSSSSSSSSPPASHSLSLPGPAALRCVCTVPPHRPTKFPPITPALPSSMPLPRGERMREGESESVAAGNTYWPFYRSKGMRFIRPGPACFALSTGRVIVRMW